MNRLIAITGPSCGGKTTLKNELLREMGGDAVCIRTTTTRNRRVGEEHGRDYLFRSKMQFCEILDDGGFLESVVVDGQFYGIELAELERVGESCDTAIVVATPSGLHSLAHWAEAHGVRLIRVLASAPVGELRRRLQGRRGSADEMEINRRLARVVDEADTWQPGQFDVLADSDVRVAAATIARLS